MGWRFSWLLLWQRLVQAFIYLLSLPLGFFMRWPPLLPGWYVTWRKKIPVIACRDVNDTETESFIRDKDPDLIISAYFSRILKGNIISLPKRGVLNIHPGRLPVYKGAMSYFWALKNGEDRAGVTLHWEYSFSALFCHP